MLRSCYDASEKKIIFIFNIKFLLDLSKKKAFHENLIRKPYYGESVSSLHLYVILPEQDAYIFKRTT